MNRWSQRWRDLLETDRPLVARRVNQGAKLLQSGRVSAVRIAAGLITAKVQGSHATPLGVEIAVETLSDADWSIVAAALGSQVRHRARLLAGQVPEGLDAQLAAQSTYLFPRRNEIDVRCGCRDSIEPCAHVAAVWLAVGAQLAADPFVLLRLRGRGRERLLADAAASRQADKVRTGPGVDPAALDATHWTVAGGDVSDLELGPAPAPTTVAGPLRLLGDPPGWQGAASPADLFGPLVAGAAAWAVAQLDPPDSKPGGTT